MPKYNVHLIIQLNAASIDNAIGLVNAKLAEKDVISEMQYEIHAVKTLGEGELDY